jgi:hypothetical protein
MTSGPLPSRFYRADPADPDAPLVLTAYLGPYHGLIRPGDRVVYENPYWRQADGSYKTGGMDGPLVITELVDVFRNGISPQAILNDGEWEVSASNLRAITDEPEGRKEITQ